MNCQTVRAGLRPGFLDVEGAVERRALVAHLRGCRSCRELAVTVEPTVIFCLGPEEATGDSEVEEIRNTVQAMRRIRALESSWAGTSGRGLALGLLAALLVVAVLVLPAPGRNGEEETVPFADALGVGAGLIDLPPLRSTAAEVTIRLELERLAIGEAGSSSPSRIAALVMTVPVGTAVDRRLGSDYRVRFDLSPGSSGADPILENFTLSQLSNTPEDPLIHADLRPVGDRPIVLGVPVGKSGPTQLRLHLTTTSTEDH